MTDILTCFNEVGNNFGGKMFMGKSNVKCCCQSEMIIDKKICKLLPPLSDYFFHYQFVMGEVEIIDNKIIKFVLLVKEFYSRKLSFKFFETFQY